MRLENWLLAAAMACLTGGGATASAQDHALSAGFPAEIMDAFSGAVEVNRVAMLELGKIALGGEDIVLEATRLADIAVALGGEMRDHEIGYDAFSALCYDLADGTVAWLLSDLQSETGTVSLVVNETGPSAPVWGCAPLDGVLEHALPGIGVSIKTVHEHFGPAPERGTDLTIYEHFEVVPGSAATKLVIYAADPFNIRALGIAKLGG